MGTRTTTTSGSATWGVTFGTTGITGVVTACDVADEPIYAQQMNEVGAVIQTVMYDEHKTVNATIEVASSVDFQTLPTQITIAGVDGMITSQRLVESNNAFRKYEVTIECWTNSDEMSGV